MLTGLQGLPSSIKPHLVNLLLRFIKQLSRIIMNLKMVVILVLIGYFTQGAHSECCEAWTPFGGKCYQVFYESKTFGEAEILCLSYGGHLASVNSEGENNFLASLMQETGYFWVGGHDVVTETSWQWTDGSTWSYSDWKTNEPSKGYTSNCLRYSASYTVGRFYGDYSCSTSMNYVCEIPYQTTTKTSDNDELKAHGGEKDFQLFLQNMLGALNKKTSS